MFLSRATRGSSCDRRRKRERQEHARQDFSGVITADSGTISVFGSTPTSPIEARQLGVATIFQEILVADDASVVDNLFVGTDGLWRKRFSRRGAYDVARDMMARFTGTEIDPDQMVGNLPISVKQWIVIGRAFLTQPKALILDGLLLAALISTPRHGSTKKSARCATAV